MAAKSKAKRIQSSSTQNNGVSEETKLIVTILLLALAYPVGVLLMWLWTSWPKWLKFIVTVPLAIIILAILATSLLLVKVYDNAKEEMDKPAPTITTATASPSSTLKKI